MVLCKPLIRPLATSVGFLAVYLPVNQSYQKSSQHGLNPTIDASTILIMLMILPKARFCEYEVGEDEVIGVSTSILSKVLSIKDKSQGLMFTTKEENGAAA